MDGVGRTPPLSSARRVVEVRHSDSPPLDMKLMPNGATFVPRGWGKQEEDPGDCGCTGRDRTSRTTGWYSNAMLGLEDHGTLDVNDTLMGHAFMAQGACQVRWTGQLMRHRVPAVVGGSVHHGLCGRGDTQPHLAGNQVVAFIQVASGDEMTYSRSESIPQKVRQMLDTLGAPPRLCTFLSRDSISTWVIPSKPMIWCCMSSTNFKCLMPPRGCWRAWCRALSRR